MIIVPVRSVEMQLLVSIVFDVAGSAGSAEIRHAGPGSASSKNKKVPGGAAAGVRREAARRGRTE